MPADITTEFVLTDRSSFIAVNQRLDDLLSLEVGSLSETGRPITLLDIYRCVDQGSWLGRQVSRLTARLAGKGSVDDSAVSRLFDALPVATRQTVEHKLDSVSRAFELFSWGRTRSPGFRGDVSDFVDRMEGLAGFLKKCGELVKSRRLTERIDKYVVGVTGRLQPVHDASRELEEVGVRLLVKAVALLDSRTPPDSPAVGKKFVRFLQKSEAVPPAQLAFVHDPAAPIDGFVRTLYGQFTAFVQDLANKALKSEGARTQLHGIVSELTNRLQTDDQLRGLLSMHRDDAGDEAMTLTRADLLPIARRLN